MACGEPLATCCFHRRIVPAAVSQFDQRRDSGADGRVKRAWLGIADGYVITRKLASLLKLPVQEGIMITKIVRDSPADKAGLRGASKRVRIGFQTYIDVGGDIITSFAGQKINSGKDLRKIIRKQKIDSKIPIKIYRGNKEVSIKVKLEANP